MSNNPPFPFAFHFRPTYAIIALSAIAAVPLAAAIYVWMNMGRLLTTDVLLFPAILLLTSIGAVVRLGFLRTISLVVEGENLIVVRRPLVRLFGSFAIYPRNTIRLLRYRFEIRQYRDRRSSSVSIYFLDLLKTDGQAITLIRSSEQPLPREMPRLLAAALRVDYQDYVVPPP